MLKAIGSKKDLTSLEYYDYIEDLLQSREVQQLKNYQHHVKTTRFQHSLNVSYYTYRLCKRLGWDSRAAARAGLLHDLYFYESNAKHEKHLKTHPKLALTNAEKAFKINARERDIIKKHMFPLTLSLPKYKETAAIIVVDKLCACMEYLKV
jgi:uncharacterized protein